MSLVPTVAIETRRHELEAERLKLDEEELKVRQQRLILERDEITFRRRVLDYQCAQYFGKASMNTLSDACKVAPRLTTSNTMPQEDNLQLENKADSVTDRRVQVWWRGDKRFYKGKIVKTGVFTMTDRHSGKAVTRATMSPRRPLIRSARERLAAPNQLVTSDAALPRRASRQE
jgi:hypothetical protein